MCILRIILGIRRLESGFEEERALSGDNVWRREVALRKSKKKILLAFFLNFNKAAEPFRQP
jgi:hypothetical protein